MDEIELRDKTIIAVKESISNYVSKEADANEMIGMFLDDSAVDLIADNIADYVVDKVEIFKRALRNAIKYYGFDLCPDPDCIPINECGSEGCINHLQEGWIKQAEREIEEERK